MCRGFTVYFGQNWENVVAAGRFSVLKVVNFFSLIFIITQMRLKFTSLSLLDNQKMPRPITPLFKFQKLQLSQKFACVRFSNFTYLISNIIPCPNPLRMGLNNFFVHKTCSREVCLSKPTVKYN